MSSKIISTTVVGMSNFSTVHQNNNDRYFMFDIDGGCVLNNGHIEKPFQNNNLLLVLTSGIGEHASVEVVSLLIIETIKTSLLESTKSPKQLSPYSRLEAAIEEANRAVWMERKRNPKLHNIGTFVTALLIEQDCAYIAYLKDSYAYILRQNRIKPIDTDSSFVWSMLKTGRITPEVAGMNNKKRDILLEGIGATEYLHVTNICIEMQAGDIFLLCNDELSSKMWAYANGIENLIQKNQNLEAIASAFMDLVKQRGQIDNITLVLAQVEGNGLKSPPIYNLLTGQIKILNSFDPETSDPKKIRKIS